MKFKNVFLAMAFVFAIGLSFATERHQGTVWANMDGNPIQVEATDCGIAEVQCFGKFEEDGPQYPLFRDEQLTVPVLGAGDAVIITLSQN